MKSRLKLPSTGHMTAQQREIHDDVLRTRGNVQGPFLAWLLSPGLAEPAQKLGAFCRYGTSLSPQESELLILLVAAHYHCPAEQEIHEPIARNAGLSEQVLLGIRRGDAVALDTTRLQLLAECAGELLGRKKLPQPLYARAVAEFGEPALVEIVAVIGYYALVAYTLNAFEMSVR